METTDMKY